MLEVISRAETGLPPDQTIETASFRSGSMNTEGGGCILVFISIFTSLPISKMEGSAYSRNGVTVSLGMSWT